MNKNKPKVGLFFLAGQSWWDAGIDNAKEGSYVGFIERVEEEVASIIEVLEKDYVVVSSGLLHTTDDAIKEARKYNNENVDAIIFCPIIWTNDPPVISFIEEVKRVPLLLWAYDPYCGFPSYFKIEEWLQASGPVSVQQSSNIFKRYKWDYNVVFGNEKEEDTLKEIKAFIKAAEVKKNLVGSIIGVLPSPCRVVVSTWVDELYILEKFGVRLLYISVDEYAKIIKEIKEKDAQEYVSYLRSRYPVDNVDYDTLFLSAKQSLALVRLIEEYKLSGIALEDFNEEIYRILGFRPHLYHPRFGDLKCTIGFEADILGVLATIIASRLSGKIGMFNEFFSVDRKKNVILMGHPGHGEISMGDPKTFMITYDLEFDISQKRGAWLSYRAKEGEMTFLNFTPEYGKLKVTAWRGRAIPGPRVMEGYSHMIVEPYGNALKIFKKIVEMGLIQHWGTVYGDIVKELMYFTNQMDLDLQILSPF